MHSEPAPFFHWLHNGELCHADSSALTVSEISHFTGTGIFETIPLYHGRPFALEDHWVRLREGALRLDLGFPTQNQLRDQIELLVNNNELTATPLARARVTILSSSGVDSATHQFLAVSLPPSRPSSARVITLPFARNEKSALSGIKTINYGENEVALQQARKLGADEALFQNTRGNLCEGIWSNIFVKIGGRWLTPPLDSGCLPGVTRKQVLMMGKSIGVPIEQAEIPEENFGAIESAFLTSSIREVQPIASLDRRELDLGPQSEIDRIAHLFRDWIAHEVSSTN